MPSYESGTELIDAIIRQGNKFISEFGDIPDQYWDTLQPDVDDRTPRQMLAYQLGWMNLLLEWEHAEEQGHVAAMPAEGYAWNQLGKLYESFYATWQDAAPQQMIDTFHEQVNHICWMVTSFSQQELFEVGQRQWASSTQSSWPVWKWIHINTVAPFTTFRTKIRHWKRAMEQWDDLM